MSREIQSRDLSRCCSCRSYKVSPISRRRYVSRLCLGSVYRAIHIENRGDRRKNPTRCAFELLCSHLSRDSDAESVPSRRLEYSRRLRVIDTILIEGNNCSIRRLSPCRKKRSPVTIFAENICYLLYIRTNKYSVLVFIFQTSTIYYLLVGNKWNR